MMFPFASLSDERRALGLALAVVIGAAFGFVLERSGLGRAQKLMDQFRGTDMTALKVMLTAIVTAMLGVVILSDVELLDLQAVSRAYPTFLWPMIAGGLLLGVGAVLSGYCPGTAFVAAASGKVDGLFSVVGLVVGGALYAELQPRLGGFHDSGELGAFFLHEWLGIPRALVAAGVVVLVMATIGGMERVERTLGRGVEPAPARAGTSVMVALLAVALVGVVTLAFPVVAATR